MKAALVIMAAGLGSHYGGNKQVDGVGPGGEILMEYSIHDAIRAGFTKIVFIIKDDMVDLMRTLCGDRIAGLTARDGEPVEVCYAVQDYSSLPAFYTVPAGRTKPFGTAHAVLAAREALAGFDGDVLVLNGGSITADLTGDRLTPFELTRASYGDAA